jgi:PAS domain S-box-containing protein
VGESLACGYLLGALKGQGLVGLTSSVQLYPRPFSGKDRLRMTTSDQLGVPLSASVIAPNVPLGAEEAFALLVGEATEYAFFTLSPVGLVSSWNRGAECIEGYQRTEVIGQHFSLFYLPADRAAGIPGQELSRAAKEGRAEAEGWRVRRDGSLFWASVVVTPIWDELRRLRGFAKLVRDSSGRRAREELAERTARLADRERIASSLAGTLVRHLFEVGLQLGSVLALTEDQTVLRRVREATKGIDESIKYVRQAVFELHPNCWADSAPSQSSGNDARGAPGPR